MSIVIGPLHSRDLDPTEAAAPWLVLRHRGHDLRFFAPGGAIARVDPRMLGERPAGQG